MRYHPCMSALFTSARTSCRCPDKLLASPSLISHMLVMMVVVLLPGPHSFASYAVLARSGASSRKEVQEYIGEVEALARRLYRDIFESLGLDDKYIEEEVPGIPRVIMAINYYPPCPDPTLTLGLSGHSDINSFTILHPGDVPGLQIKHKGSWVPVFPVDPSAFVINLADQIEILTNGTYKSIEHRVVTNQDKPRLSIACFFGPMEDTIVAPLPKLLNENSPSLYKPIEFKEYVKNFITNGLQPD